MTTDTTSIHDTTTHASPAPGKFENMPNVIKDHLFTIFLGIAAIVTWFALQANGFHGKVQYDEDMQVIISIYNGVIMTYPLFLALKARGKQQYAGARIAIIAASVVFTIFLLPITVRVFAAVGESAWSIPFFGPVVLPIVAIIAHAVAASLLTRGASKDDDTVSQDKAKIRGLEENIVSAETDYNLAKTKSTAHADAEANAKTKFEEADEIAKEHAKTYKDAKKAFDESEAVLAEAAIKVKIKGNQQGQVGVKVQIEQLESKLKQTNASNLKAQYEKDIEAKNGELGALMTEADTLANELEAATVTVENSDEKQAMDDAFAASEGVSLTAKQANDDYEAATKAAKEPSRAMQVAGDVLEKLKADRDDIHARISASATAKKGSWGNVVFGPIGFLVIAFGLYPVWYGWVSLSFQVVLIG